MLEMTYSMGVLFSKLYDLFMQPLEQKGLAGIRKPLIHQAKGKVLEIGSGTGFNFPYYRQGVEVIAIEPQRLMRERSLRRSSRAQVLINVMDGSAEELPFGDNTFDTVVGTLVLCTIPNPAKALKELRRVCKPGGKILLLEHVRLDRPILGRIQDWLTPVWKHLCDGCHLNRNTLELVTKAGFQDVRVTRHYKDILLEIEVINDAR
jgi:ubiquinone/menaquinone biosynthesis C-methylase UbiE